MNTTWRRGLKLSVLGLLFCSAQAAADPVLTVSDLGPNGSSNREWLVEVAPDPALFTNTGEGLGGSLTVELAFEITGSDLVAPTVNAIDWPFDNPGNNPFTSGVTFGLETDPTAGTVFAAFGTEFLTTGDAVELLTIETMGTGATTLSWGGHTLLPGTPFEYAGSRIAQGVANFDGYEGSMVVGDGEVDGDFDNDGVWDCADINALSSAIAATSSDVSFDMNGDGAITLADITDAGNGWLAVGGANNSDATGGNPFLQGDANLDGSVDVSDFNMWNGSKFTATDAWCSGDFNADGSVDVSDFNVWNGRKFTSSSGAALVPEPGTAALWAIGLIGWVFTTRRHRVR